MSEEIHSDRCITERLLSPGRSEWALMGPAHAISGAGISALSIGLAMFFGDWIMANIFLMSAAIVALFIGVATGSALVPDLDNSRSTVRSSLGFVGAALSSVFRASALLIQTVIRTKRDDSTPNPHRGFWHTLVGAAVLGAGAIGLSSISLELFEFDPLGTVTLGGVFYFTITTVMLHLFFAGVAKSRIKKIRKIPIVGELLSFILSMVVTASLLAFAPEGEVIWLGVAIAFGCAIHILGDGLTVDGVPIFFPLPVITKGKFWWKTRFAKFKADDEKLNKFIYRFSVFLIVVGILFAVASIFV